MNRIIGNLFLGNFEAAEDFDSLALYNVNHILTINERKLDKRIYRQKCITVEHISLADIYFVNLLIHFDDTYEFIDKGLQTGGVLVHCSSGVSRSATVVIAYLMKKHRYKFEDALTVVKTKRSKIRPNQGFILQLHLYQQMSFTVDESATCYKLFLLRLAANDMSRIRQISPNHRFILTNAPEVDESPTSQEKRYCCNICNKILASESNRLSHIDKKIGKVDCQRKLYVEPLPWMKVTDNESGSLFCPACENVVGSFKWCTFNYCPCGYLMSPSFLLTNVSIYVSS